MRLFPPIILLLFFIGKSRFISSTWSIGDGEPVSDVEKVLVQEIVAAEEFYVVTRFFTGRVLNMEAIARTFKLLWRTQKWFEM